MSSLTIPTAVGIGGFIGALARFYLSSAVTKLSGDEFSFVGTLVVNLTGCFLIGILATVVVRSDHLSPTMEKCLITGLLGSLTTFSTFAIDSLNLLMDGRVGAAAANISINLCAGILLVWLGVLVTAALYADPSTEA